MYEDRLGTDHPRSPGDGSQENRLEVIVVWIGGSKECLAEWAKAKKLEDVPMAVVPADDPLLKDWHIPEKVRRLTVLLRRTKVVANFPEPTGRNMPSFEIAVSGLR